MADPNTGALSDAQLAAAYSDDTSGGGAIPNAPFNENLAAEAVNGLFPGSRITGQGRTGERNAEVGGVPNSMHREDQVGGAQAEDFVAPGVSQADALARIRGAGLPETEFFLEGARGGQGQHFHWGWRNGAFQPLPQGTQSESQPTQTPQPTGALSDADLMATYSKPAAAPAGGGALSDADLAAQYAPKPAAAATPQPAPAFDWDTLSNLATGVKNVVTGTQPLSDPNKPQSSTWDTLKDLVTGIPADFEHAGGGLLEAAGQSTPASVAGSLVGDVTMNPTAGDTAANAIKANTPAWFGQPIAPGVAKTGADLVNSANADIKKNAPNLRPDSAAQMAFDVAQGTIQIAPLMAASLVTKSPAPVMAGIAAQAYGDTYAASITAKRTPEQARADATFSAAAQAIPAMLPFHALMADGGTFLSKTLSTAGANAGQNAISTILQEAYDKGVIGKDPNETWGDVVGKVVHSGLVGAFMGATMGAGEHLIAKALPAKAQPEASPAATPETPPPAAPAVQPQAPTPAPAPQAAAAPTPPASSVEPVHSPVTWAQTGWKDAQGNIHPLGTPGTPGAPPVTQTEVPTSNPVEKSNPPPQAAAPAALSDADVAAATTPPPVTGFTTAKGSTYSVNPDGTTTRDKAARPDVGHEGQSGPQPPSEATIYVTPAQADQLSLIQTQGGAPMAVKPRPDGSWGVQYTGGKDAGKFERRTVVQPQVTPAVGLIPVETWKGGATVHFGNPITEVRGAAPSSETPVSTSETANSSSLTADQARAALVSNIDPATGIRPKGNKALRDFRAKMQASIDGATQNQPSVSRETSGKTPNDEAPPKPVKPVTKGSASDQVAPTPKGAAPEGNAGIRPALRGAGEEAVPGAAPDFVKTFPEPKDDGITGEGRPGVFADGNPKTPEERQTALKAYHEEATNAAVEPIQRVDAADQALRTGKDPVSGKAPKPGYPTGEFEAKWTAERTDAVRDFEDHIGQYADYFGNPAADQFQEHILANHDETGGMRKRVENQDGLDEAKPETLRHYAEQFDIPTKGRAPQDIVDDLRKQGAEGRQGGGVIATRSTAPEAVTRLQADPEVPAPTFEKFRSILAKNTELLEERGGDGTRFRVKNSTGADMEFGNYGKSTSIIGGSDGKGLGYVGSTYSAKARNDFIRQFNADHGGGPSPKPGPKKVETITGTGGKFSDESAEGVRVRHLEKTQTPPQKRLLKTVTDHAAKGSLVQTYYESGDRKRPAVQYVPPGVEGHINGRDRVFRPGDTPEHIASTIDEANRMRPQKGLPKPDLTPEKQAEAAEFQRNLKPGERAGEEIDEPTEDDRVQMEADRAEEEQERSDQEIDRGNRSKAKFDPADHVQKLVDRIRKTDKSLGVPAIAKDFGLKPGEARRVIGALAARPSTETGAKLSGDGTLRRNPVQKGPQDVASFLAARGGVNNSEGHDLVKGLGLQQLVPGHGPLIRPKGIGLDRAGEALWEAGFFGPIATTPRPDEAEVIEKLIETAGRKKVYAPEKQAEVHEAEEGQRAQDANDAAEADIRDEARKMGEQLSDEDISQIMGEMGAHGMDAESAVAEHIERQAMQGVEQAHDETGDDQYQTEAVPFHGGEGEADRGTDEGVERPAPEPDDARGERETAETAENDTGEARELATERGAEGLPQTILPGAERSARQLAAAREASGRGKARSAKEQREPGGLFDEGKPDDEPLMFKMGTESLVSGNNRADMTYTPAFDAKRAELEPVLRDRLDKLGLHDTALKLPDTIRAVSDGTAVQADGFHLRNVIGMALADQTSEHSEVIDHEAIHALRAMDVFTPSEWSVLERRAPDWAKRYDVDERYPEATPEGRAEEAIAHAFPDYRAGKLADESTPVKRIFRKIENFLEAVRNAFHGLGFKSADDVFKKVATGEVGARARATDADELRFAKKKRDEVTEELRAKPPGFVTRVLGEKTENMLSKIGDSADRLLPDSIKDAGSAIRMALTPMAEGSNAARAAAKDFANGMRTARVIGGRQVEYLGKEFTPEELKTMWDAADAESVLQQQGVNDRRGQGLDTLTPKQRKAVETFQADGNSGLARATELGMFKSEGLPSHVPRMVVALGSDGKYGRLKPGDKDVAHGLDAIGRNLKTTTPNLKQRKYLTREETEEAAQALDPGALVVRDFRTLPLATMRLNEAIAGRELINKIEAIGADAGENTVSEGSDPTIGDNSGQKWFTLDHPAFKVYRPKFIREGERAGQVLQDQDGNPIFERVPRYVRGDFEGPLRAVLSQDQSKIYKAAMDVKGKTMSVVMYSPAMHNMVIWGKAFPAAPWKMINPLWRDADGRIHVSVELYGRGYAAKNDPVTMKEALNNGLDPVGHRYFNQDASAIMEEPNVKPGRSWTSQIVAAVPNLFSRDAGTAVKRAVDKMGDFWHNKMLWDRVGDLQMGLYLHMRDKAIKAGNDPQTAGRMAAHFANRYAGALPMESMSRIARQTANMLLFSRSFTLTNLGAFKDLAAGLPKDVQAQILRDKGVDALNRIQGTARRKAAALLATDIFLSHVGLFMAQYAMAWATGAQFHAPSQNEPDRQNRFLMGYQKDGTAIYGRLPTGKVGEELQDWVTEPAAIGTRKLSMFGQLAYGLAANNQGFDRKIYDPNDQTAAGWFKNLARIVTYGAETVAPLSPFQGIGDIVRGKGEVGTNIAKVLLPLAGITVSKGAPGGPAVGELYHAGDEHDFQVGEQMAGIRQKIVDGDSKGAAQQMQALGFPKWKIQWTIRSTLDPRARASKTQIQNYMRDASPEDQAKLKLMLKEGQPAPASDQHSSLAPGDLGPIIRDPAKLQRAADAGKTWSRDDAVKALRGSGMSATADLLRDAPDDLASAAG